MWRCSVRPDPRGLRVQKLRAKMAARIPWNLLSSAHGPVGGCNFNGVERVNGGAFWGSRSLCIEAASVVSRFLDTLLFVRNLTGRVGCHGRNRRCRLAIEPISL